jgi:molecular chaperone HtpG
LQHNSSLDKIRKAITKKVISELKTKMEKDRESYLTFWENFGAVIKEGLCESLPDDEREKLLDICLFKSASHDKLVSLSEYVASMKEGQETIFYLSGDSAEKARTSPQLEGFLKHDIDALLFVDTVDDFWVNVMHEYKGKALKSVTRSGIELDNLLNPKKEGEEEKPEKEVSDQDQIIIDFFKKALGTSIMDAKVSGKLVDSPVCLSVAEGAMDIRMERYLKEQRQIGNSFAKIIEVNMTHPIIVKVAKAIDMGDETFAEELVLALYDQACIIEGEPLSNISAFSKRMNSLFSRI